MLLIVSDLPIFSATEVKGQIIWVVIDFHSFYHEFIMYQVNPGTKFYNRCQRWLWTNLKCRPRLLILFLFFIKKERKIEIKKKKERKRKEIKKQR